LEEKEILVKKIAALSALALAATAGSSFGVATLETKFLAQVTTGSGATYMVDNVAGPLSFPAGSTVRLTLQYRISDPASGATTNPRGLVGANFDLLASGPAGGTSSRSALTGDGTFISGEAYGAPGTANTDTYPYTGENADGFTGLHNAYRGGLSGGDPDLALSNGTFAGRNVTGLVPLSLSAASFPQNAGIAGNPTGWFGLFSFNFTNSGATGDVTFSFAPATTTANPNGQFRYWKRGTTSPVTGTSFQNGSITLNFINPNTPPTIVSNVSNPAPMTWTQAPDFTPAPDINNLLIATASDAEGMVLAGVTAGVIGPGPANPVGLNVVQTGPNTFGVFLTYEISNADLAGGPSSFQILITAVDNDGTPLAAEPKIITIHLVPAPGAAALLGLGGLLAARRRRA
jgi:hypothetical protein